MQPTDDRGGVSAAPPQQRSSSRWKWIVFGCLGAFTLSLLLVGGGCGAIMYFAAKQMQKTADVGEAYLRAQPGIEAAVGKIQKIEYRLLGTHIHSATKSGAAEIVYTIEGSEKTLSATVWLEHSGGDWSAVGCEAGTGENAVKVGRSVVVPKKNSGSSSWDD